MLGSMARRYAAVGGSDTERGRCRASRGPKVAESRYRSLSGDSRRVGRGREKADASAYGTDRLTLLCNTPQNMIVALAAGYSTAYVATAPAPSAAVSSHSRSPVARMQIGVQRTPVLLQLRAHVAAFISCEKTASIPSFPERRSHRFLSQVTRILFPALRWLAPLRLPRA